ncbi:MAG: hypothetical protein E6J78_07450 [Deltaproteobacteria bacterium]|nr:MAG: hypothetical protein E6J78_07450 [Deltaproteobacteria bacterium]
MARRALIIAALLCAVSARAQDAGQQKAREDRSMLSKEDEEIVKELALLERMELVKNLELFEADKEKDAEGKPPPERQP